MGRPPVIKNALQGERLNIVLKEQGLMKKELAEIVSVSAASITRYVKCEDRLNEDVATIISERFGYNKDWLLCKDDRKTQYEVLLNEVEEANISITSSFVILLDALDLLGLKYTLQPSADISFTEEQWNRFSIYQQIPMSDIHISRNGKDIAKLSADDLSLLQKRLTRYAKMLIEEAIEEGSGIDGEQ